MMTQTIEIPAVDNDKAWDPNAAGQLPDGWNRVTCQVAEGDTSKSGNPQIAFEFSNKHGNIKDWLTITEKSMGRVAQVFKAFGIVHTGGAFNPKPLETRQVEVLVQTEASYNDPTKFYPKVKAYRPVEGEDPTPEHAGRPAQAQMPATATAPPGPAYQNEDDIPF